MFSIKVIKYRTLPLLEHDIGADILATCKQASELATTSWRYKTPESDMKDSCLITAIAVPRIPVFMLLLALQFPQGNVKKVR